VDADQRDRGRDLEVTDALITWLRAALDEDEADAIAAMGDIHDTTWTADTHTDKPAGHTDEEYHVGIVLDGRTVIAQCGEEGFDNGAARATHIARHDPARVLREVAAKKAIMARHCVDEDAADPRFRHPKPRIPCRGCGWDDQQGTWATYNINDCPELRDLAAVYADRPGYREEWRP
jgi:hypothetical protein